MCGFVAFQVAAPLGPLVLLLHQQRMLHTNQKFRPSVEQVQQQLDLPIAGGLAVHLQGAMDLQIGRRLVLLRWPSCLVERGGRDHDRNMTWRKRVPVDETAVVGARRTALRALRDAVDLHRGEQRIFLHPLELVVGVAVLRLPEQGTVRDRGLLAGALAVLAENAGIVQDHGQIANALAVLADQQGHRRERDFGRIVGALAVLADHQGIGQDNGLLAGALAVRLLAGALATVLVAHRDGLGLSFCGGDTIFDFAAAGTLLVLLSH